MNNCIMQGGVKTTWEWSYDDANNGRFRPYATDPYILLGVYVEVVANGAAGATLDLGTSIGGTQIATGIPIDVNGSFQFTFVKVEVAAAGYLYSTPSVAMADNSMIIRYTVMTNHATTRGLYVNTVGNARITNCTIESNGASDAVYISDVAETGNGFKISNSHIETMDPTNQKSVTCQSAYIGVPIYNSTFIGPFTNVSGLVHENSGIATVADTTTSIVVHHGCGYIPSAGHINVHPIEPLNNAASYYVDTIDIDHFTIHTNIDPGVDVDFAWSVVKTL